MDKYLKTIINSGIWVVATTNVMKNNNIRYGYMVLQGDVHGPAVATGTTVTSAYSGIVPLVKLPWIPRITKF